MFSSSDTQVRILLRRPESCVVFRRAVFFAFAGNLASAAQQPWGYCIFGTLLRWENNEKQPQKQLVYTCSEVFKMKFPHF